MNLTIAAGFRLSIPTNFGSPLALEELRKWGEQWRDGHPHFYAAQA